MAIESISTGFDDSTVEQGWSITATSGSGAGLTANSRTGVGGSIAGAAISYTFAAAWSTKYLDFGMKFNHNVLSGTSWLLFQEGATIHLAVRFDSAGHILLYRGNGTTLLATSTWAHPGVSAPDIWEHFGFKVIISDTVGVFECRVNEVVVATFSGDTRNGGTTGLIDLIAFNRVTTGSGNLVFLDDMVFDTADYNGDCQIRQLVPTGNGDSSGWLGSDGNSTDNYALVDETNSSMSDYVGASVSGTEDLYAMADLPSGLTVLEMHEVIYALKSDAGTSPSLLPYAKGQSGGTRSDTALPALTTSALVYKAEPRTTDPDGNALTVARVNAMQVGLKIA